MAHLTLAGRSDDGKRLLLVDDNGTEFTLDVDASLRAAIRGEHVRIGQLEFQMESALRPRDIQARIRAGETPDEVAQAAHTTVEKIMPFAAPVMAERAHVAQRALSSSLRRPAGESGARTLGEAVEGHLRALDADPEQVEWDAWRRGDGRWTLTAQYATGQRSGTASFTLDVRGNFATSDDDDARWLVGDLPTSGAGDPARSEQARDDLARARGRRLSAVPAEELPLGEDALELVTGAEPAAGDEPAGAPSASDEADPSETTLDLTEQLREAPQTGKHDQPDRPDGADGANGTPDQPAADDGSAAAEEPAEQDPAAHEPPARRPVRKSRGRASVPSWDEIMFGGSSSPGSQE